MQAKRKNSMAAQKGRRLKAKEPSLIKEASNRGIEGRIRVDAQDGTTEGFIDVPPQASAPVTLPSRNQIKRDAWEEFKTEVLCACMRVRRGEGIEDVIRDVENRVIQPWIMQRRISNTTADKMVNHLRNRLQTSRLTNFGNALL